jgi:hypothetical protein
MEAVHKRLWRAGTRFMMGVLMLIRCILPNTMLEKKLNEYDNNLKKRNLILMSNKEQTEKYKWGVNSNSSLIANKCVGDVAGGSRVFQKSLNHFV